MYTTTEPKQRGNLFLYLKEVEILKWFVKIRFDLKFGKRRFNTLYPQYPLKRNGPYYNREKLNRSASAMLKANSILAASGGSG